MKKEDITGIIAIVQSEYPHLRLGQLLVCAANYGGWTQDDIFYCPDDILKAGLLEMYNRACPVKPQ